MVKERARSRAQRLVPAIGGLGAVALLAMSRRLEGSERGLLMAAAIGLVLVFVIVAALIATRRDSSRD